MIRKILQGLKYSWEGLVMTFKKETSFKYEFFLALILFPLALYFPISTVEKIILLIPLFLILMAELLNTGIEKVVDAVSQGQKQPLYKFAKDCGSASVLMGFMLLLLSWGFILTPYFNMPLNKIFIFINRPESK